MGVQTGLSINSIQRILWIYNINNIWWCGVQTGGSAWWGCRPSRASRQASPFAPLSLALSSRYRIIYIYIYIYNIVLQA